MKILTNSGDDNPVKGGFRCTGLPAQALKGCHYYRGIYALAIIGQDQKGDVMSLLLYTSALKKRQYPAFSGRRPLL